MTATAPTLNQRMSASRSAGSHTHPGWFVCRECWDERPARYLPRLVGDRDPGRPLHGREVAAMSADCLCPDPWCPVHARCVCGSELIILPDDPAFCPACGHDVMPRGACGRGQE